MQNIPHQPGSKKIQKIAIACTLFSSFLFSHSLHAATPEGPSTNTIRVVPVEATPEPDTVKTHIVFPEEGEVKKDNPVSVQIRLEGFPLGFKSDFVREREIRNSQRGQTLQVLVDDFPSMEIEIPIDDTADTEEIDFDQTLESRIPYKLKKGLHIIRAFPVRSFGESLKGEGCFASRYFYMGSKTEKAPDLSVPYLTYNEPKGTFSSGKPILLDFYICNTQLSKDGYKVRVTIDKVDKRILESWAPYYIYGLKKGSHTIKLELLDPQNSVLPSLFKDTERTIVVQ